MTEPQFLSVTQVNQLFRGVLQAACPEVRFKGEISQLTRASSGHCYLTLKDEVNSVSIVIWGSTAGKLSFKLKEGLEVNCYGRPDVYPKNGRLQVVVSKIEQAGEGALKQKFLELQAKLEKEGLFDPSRKRPLPFLPESIGIVTSKSGAAIHDIMKKISERMPIVPVYLFDARVQGDGAAKEIVAGIKYFNSEKKVSVIIIGRGGGSLEDLWPFNEEIVARAVFASEIPIISAVGHEVDTSLSDLAADLRAPTPTAAGEIVVPKRSDLLDRIDGLNNRLLDFSRWFSPKVQNIDELELKLSRAAERLIEKAKLNFEKRKVDLNNIKPDKLFADYHRKLESTLSALKSSVIEQLNARKNVLGNINVRIGRIDPKQKIIFYSEKLSSHQKRLNHLILNSLATRKEKLLTAQQLLAVVNPNAVLSRGFALVKRQGHVVTKAKDFKVGDDIELQFAEDSAAATVRQISTARQVNPGELVSSEKNVSFRQESDKQGKKKVTPGQGELFS